ncbi:hypothetical protein CSA56_17220 [candidate division KSB3 bacterium]|uniref:UPF0597 protein CSA56_17220 n=1 Tax=candidate division KSB3 bacterium TaxID=2044937 RepID=A0A2G6K886_9BACT|nr:MAG: hypothetical protein CSA56_17220 [candidate division KSB3 bacterium]
MNISKYHSLIEILKKEITPALGCTEPVTVALAAAWAAKAAGGTPKAITIRVDKNVYKNGLGVGVPGTGEFGLHIAAAAGAVAGDPKLGLEVLNPLTDDDVRHAKALLASENVAVNMQTGTTGVYVDAVVTSDIAEGLASIRDRHDNVTSVLRDNAVFPEFQKLGEQGRAEADTESFNPIHQYRLDELMECIQYAPLDKLRFLKTSLEANTTFARNSLEQSTQSRIGSSMLRLMEKGRIHGDLIGKMKYWLASAVEARMGGFNMTVVSCANSGNQGLISTIPVVLAAEHVGASEELLLRAAALSSLITVYVKSFMGVLTPVCGGSVAAGLGAACAITYLFGGDSDAIERTIKNMAGSVMGIICDGAKTGCALKTSMAVGVALENAFLALEGVTVPADNGIVDASADQTIRNMGHVTKPGMSQTDDAILEIMTRRYQ